MAIANLRAADRSDGPVMTGTVADDLRFKLTEIATTHGFGGGLYVHLGHGLSSVSDPRVKTLPRRLVATGNLDGDQYLQRSDLGCDPLALRAAESLVPFGWTLGDLAAASLGQRRLRTLMEARGMRAGVIVPVQDYALGPAFLNLFHAHAVPYPQAEDPQQLDARLMLAAAQFHTAASTAPSHPGGAAHIAQLSLREMTVLRLAAIGRTEQETALSLMLSRRCIQYHLSRAVEKLGAPNKTAAVARAVSAGLIRISSDPTTPEPAPGLS